jgi:hypothetical protein
LRIRSFERLSYAPVTGRILDELRRVAGDHVRRGDFSRWIADVLGDHALATELRTLEEQHRVAARAETVPEMVAAIRGRYDVVDDDIPVPVS